MTRRTLFLWVPLLLLSCVCGEEYHRHTNNWAVIVDTSRFWSNYRHVANALSLYHSVKRLGIPDSQIILMLADQMPCNARNCFPGQVFNSRTQKINLVDGKHTTSLTNPADLSVNPTIRSYGKNVEVDYRGSEVSVANFITVLTGRHEPGTPASKKLDTDENSNIFLYMSGHGGDGFLKFQVCVLATMKINAYNEIFFMVDTCQAGSLSNALESPKVVTIGSSQTGENSYAHHSDFEVRLLRLTLMCCCFVALTYCRAPCDAVGALGHRSLHLSTLDYLQRMKVGDSIRNGTLRDLFNFYDPRMLLSTPDYRTDILGRSIDEVPITDFLGSCWTCIFTSTTKCIRSNPHQLRPPLHGDGGLRWDA
ncbi:GPI-anchor transamidase [Phytophthora cactorum]|nr:GPI-anchor transamidase [Phytophthora cactorum]